MKDSPLLNHLLGKCRVTMTLLVGLTLMLATPERAFGLYKKEGLVPFESGMVPVCWAPRINPEANVPKAIRQWVEGTWAKNANVTFTGWGNCPEQTAGAMPDQHIVFIQGTGGRSHSDEGPKSGHQSEPRPTLMELNFNASWLCDTFPLGYSNEECVIWTAVHEFGHALGFKHEHDRPDFGGCRLYDWAWPHRGGGGVELTTYDRGSVMNYCSDGAGTNKGRLTPRDIAGLQVVYGTKPAGSFIAAGGRCMDVHNIDIQDGNHVQIWDCWGGPNQLWNYSTIEGTLTPEEAPGMCLDDASGGTVIGTPLDVWNCPNRANVRWDLGQIYLRSLGGKCLEFASGNSVLRTCLLGSQWFYNSRGQFVRVGTNRCLDVGAGEIGSRARLASCEPNRFTQKFLLTRDGQLLSNGRCLEVADSMPFRVSDNRPIRLAECQGSKLAQKFNLRGWLRSSGGRCVSLAPADISRNGVRLVVGDCNRNPHFFDFYPGDVEAGF